MSTTWRGECVTDEDIARRLHFHLFEINKDDGYFIVDPNHPDPQHRGMKGDGSADFDGWLPLVEIVRFVRTKVASQGGC